MRIYKDCVEMVREVERDLHEMGVEVLIQSMQDKEVSHDEGLKKTKEVRAYGFTILAPCSRENDMVEYLFPRSTALEYCMLEFQDRISGQELNPGNSYKVRSQVWGEFLHEGKFAYTYSERLTPQLQRIIQELQSKPGTRQAILEVHNNQIDLTRMGGIARIPCSMYYQVLIREGKVDLIYTMRSCDLLTHFPVDIWLAIRLQRHLAQELGKPIGNFSYFTGSLHAYKRDLDQRGIF